MTHQGEVIGVDPLIGRISADIDKPDGRYDRSVYGPYHRIVGGASVGDVKTDLVTTACGIDLPYWDTVVHPPSEKGWWTGFTFLEERPRCGDCFP